MRASHAPAAPLEGHRDRTTTSTFRERRHHEGPKARHSPTALAGSGLHRRNCDRDRSHLDRRAAAISFWARRPNRRPTRTRRRRRFPPAPRRAAPLSGLPDFASLAERVSPSVVNISTTSQGEGPQMVVRRGRGVPARARPARILEPFERFFGPCPAPVQAAEPGLGFIISRDGLILTNNHVVENADDIQVRLANEKEYKAKVIGRDRKPTSRSSRSTSTAAPISIRPRWGLRHAARRPMVLSIGNPFGLEHSVTAGIVSAKGRFIGQATTTSSSRRTPHQSRQFGRAVAELERRGRRHQHRDLQPLRRQHRIGFAIPVNLAKELLPDLERRKGHAGWLGVMIQKVTPRSPNRCS